MAHFLRRHAAPCLPEVAGTAAGTSRFIARMSATSSACRGQAKTMQSRDLDSAPISPREACRSDRELRIAEHYA